MDRGNSYFLSDFKCVVCINASVATMEQTGFEHSSDSWTCSLEISRLQWTATEKTIHKDTCPSNSTSRIHQPCPRGHHNIWNQSVGLNMSLYQRFKATLDNQDSNGATWVIQHHDSLFKVSVSLIASFLYRFLLETCPVFRDFDINLSKTFGNTLV